MSNKVVVIGAVNLDINIETNKPYTLHDSNLVDASLNVGGVGGNIVQNLARLGHEIGMITVLGSDPVSASLQRHLESLHVDVSHSLFLHQDALNLYISILNPEHDLYLGVNDMKYVNAITPAFLETKASYLKQADIIILDNNLSEDSLQYLGKTYKDAYIAIDAVSMQKAYKLQSILPYVSLIKVNQMEKAVLEDSPGVFQKDVVTAITSGRLQLLVSNGQHDIMLYHGKDVSSIQPIPCSEVQGTSGAGDALFSGYLHGVILHQSIETSLHYATQLAYQTLQVVGSTNKEVNINDK